MQIKKNHRITRGALSLAVAGLFFAGTASAGLLGSNVTSQYYAYGGPINLFGSPTSFVANGTVQQSFGGYFNLTVFDDKIQYEYTSNTTWSSSGTSYSSGGLYIDNGNLLTFTGAPTITSIALDAGSSTVSGFGIGNFTFDAGSIAVAWADLSFSNGDKIILDINVTAVPEPETYAMLLAGLGLLGFAARRRKLKEAALV